MVQAFDVNVWTALQAGIDMLELSDIVERPPWMADALCREFVGTVNFFPDRGQPTEPAKDVCARCLVRVECLTFALERPDLHGIWAGTSGKIRRRARAAGLDVREVLDAVRRTASAGVD